MTRSISEALRPEARQYQISIAVYPAYALLTERNIARRKPGSSLSSLMRQRRKCCIESDESCGMRLCGGGMAAFDAEGLVEWQIFGKRRAHGVRHRPL